jgi:molybdopterin/thiamine biosynthesis adenylyltransferase
LQVARQAVLAFNPDSAVIAHHANVKGAEYGVEFYRGFDVVMNALDNVSARRSGSSSAHSHTRLACLPSLPPPPLALTIALTASMVRTADM